MTPLNAHFSVDVTFLPSYGLPLMHLANPWYWIVVAEAASNR